MHTTHKRTDTWNKMPPQPLTHTHTHTHRQAPPHFPCVLSVRAQSMQGNQRSTILPPGAKLVAPPPQAVMMIPLTPPPPLPLLTALFFYRTGNQTDSGALKPFLQLGDGERGPRTSLMQPPSPGLVSRSHLWKEKEGETEEEWGERWVHVCVCVCLCVKSGESGEESRVKGCFFTNPVCARRRDTVVLPQIKGRKSESLSHVS